MKNLFKKSLSGLVCLAIVTSVMSMSVHAVTLPPTPKAEKAVVSGNVIKIQIAPSDPASSFNIYYASKIDGDYKYLGYVTAKAGKSVVFTSKELDKGVYYIKIRNIAAIDGTTSASKYTTPFKVEIKNKLADKPKTTTTTAAKPKAEGEDDYMVLIKNKKLTAEVKGKGLGSTTVLLTNNTKEIIQTTIPIGSYFVAKDSKVSNMATFQAKKVIIPANGTANVTVYTAFMSTSKDTPSSSDLFTPSSLSDTATNKKLKRVLELCDKNRSGYAVTQAAAWRVTDNASDRTIKSLLRWKDNNKEVITDDDIKEATKIINEASKQLLDESKK